MKLEIAPARNIPQSAPKRIMKLFEILFDNRIINVFIYMHAYCAVVKVYEIFLSDIYSDEISEEFINASFEHSDYVTLSISPCHITLLKQITKISLKRLQTRKAKNDTQIKIFLRFCYVFSILVL